MIKRIFAAGLLWAVLSPAPAAQEGAIPPDPTEDPLMITAGFLTSHPDLKYRLKGLEAYTAGEHATAYEHFQHASYYADKPSQGMVAEMLWNGEGVARDRARAYAWMDLAAERGYRGFLGLRERYWNDLDAAERERALSVGEEVYERYGDEAAKPRIARELRRARRQVTGSRTGFTGALSIIVPGPGGSARTIDGSQFYDPRYWDPEQYAAWHDRVWMDPPTGRVDVGELETLRSDSRSDTDADVGAEPEPRP